MPDSLEDALKRHLSSDTRKHMLRLEDSSAYEVLPALPPELIKGVLRFGDKLVFAGPADCGKTSALMSLALAVAHGKPWMGNATERCGALYVNLELETTAFAHRIHRVASVMDVPPTSKRLAFLNHRGGNLDPRRFTAELRDLLVQSKLGGKDFRLVIIDPIYKLLGSGANDEESNRRATELIDGLGSIADTGDVSFVFCVEVANDDPRYQIFHELENGIGQLARDADAVLMLWPLHGKEDAYRLKGELREFESFSPISLEFRFPGFFGNPDLDKVAIASPAPTVVMSGGDVPTEVAMEDMPKETNLWKAFEALSAHPPVTVEKMAKFTNIPAFLIRAKLLQLEPNPANPRQRLRTGAGNKIVAEEE